MYFKHSPNPKEIVDDIYILPLDFKPHPCANWPLYLRPSSFKIKICSSRQDTSVWVACFLWSDAEFGRELFENRHSLEKLNFKSSGFVFLDLQISGDKTNRSRYAEISHRLITII